MGKRGIALVAGVAALSGWGLQAQAAGQTVSEVTVAWAGQQIRVSWAEDAPVANTVKLSTGKELGSTTAAGANELLVDRATIGISNDPRDKLSVVVSDPDGGSAASPVFDHFVPRQRMTMGLAGGEQAVWRLVPAYEDETPNDPLDVNTPTKYAVSLYEQGPGETCTKVLLSDSTTETGLIPRRDKPYQVSAATTNEWGTLPGSDTGDTVGRVYVTDPAMTVPATAPYGTSAVIRGGVGATYVSVSSGTKCATSSLNAATGTATLQVENAFGGSWTDVASSPLSPEQPSFQFSVLSNGAKNYRVSVTSSAKDGQVYYGNVSRMGQLRSVTRVVSAKFIKPVITYGTQPQAYLWVDPAGTQRAALQWKDPSGVWQGITYKYLYDGKGLVAFNFNRRGTFQFRWYAPATTSPDGLPVDAVYSSPFSLTVN